MNALRKGRGTGPVWSLFLDISTGLIAMADAVLDRATGSDDGSECRGSAAPRKALRKGRGTGSA